MVQSMNFNEAEEYFEYALKLQNKKQLDEALKYYFKVIDLYPQAPDPYLNIGNIYFEQKKPRLAIEMYQKALIKDRSTYRVYGNLIIAYMDIEEYNNALDAFQKAMQITNLPKEYVSYLYHNIAICYCNGFDDLDSALGYCEKALAINPDDEGTNATLLLYQRKKNNFTKINTDDLFIDCNPKNETMNNYMLDIFKKLKRNHSIYNAKLSYNLLTEKIFNQVRWLGISVANIGNTTDTLGFNPDQLEKIISSNDKAYFCYIALPVDEDEDEPYLIEETIDADTFTFRLEKLLQTPVSAIGYISFDNFQRCKTFKWIYQEKLS